MGTVTVTVDSLDAVKQRMKAAFAGKRQGERISFESFDHLWKTLAPNRLRIVQTLMGAEPVSLREIARCVGRDVRAVHADVHLLMNAGVLNKCEDGRVEFPYAAMHFDLMCTAVDERARGRSSRRGPWFPRRRKMQRLRPASPPTRTPTSCPTRSLRSYGQWGAQRPRREPASSPSRCNRNGVRSCARLASDCRRAPIGARC